jgi:hypothetical protein
MLLDNQRRGQSAKIYTGKIVDLWNKGDKVMVQSDDEVDSFDDGGSNENQLLHISLIYRGE